MFQVLDHADVVYTGELSQTTQYVIEHYETQLDETIRSGIKITYTESPFGLNEAGQSIRCSTVPNFWEPVEDWEID